MVLKHIENQCVILKSNTFQGSIYHDVRIKKQAKEEAQKMKTMKHKITKCKRKKGSIYN